MSNIGDGIIRLGSFKAKHLITGNWDFKFPKPDGTVDTLSSAHSRRTGNVKVTQFNPREYQPTRATQSLLQQTAQTARKQNKMSKKLISQYRNASQAEITDNQKLNGNSTMKVDIQKAHKDSQSGRISIFDVK